MSDIETARAEVVGDNEMTPHAKFVIAHYFQGQPATAAFRLAYPHKHLTDAALANAASIFKNSGEMKRTLESFRSLSDGKLIGIVSRVMVVLERQIINPMEAEMEISDAEIERMTDNEVRHRLRAEIQRRDMLVKQLEDKGKKPWFSMHLSDLQKLAKTASHLKDAISDNNKQIVVNMAIFGGGDGRTRQRCEIPTSPDEWQVVRDDNSVRHIPSYAAGKASVGGSKGFYCSEAAKFPGADTSKCFHSYATDDGGNSDE
ncbi:MAG: hypothetical protein ACR2PR_11230 [Pseudohongiellaceae bacterium]